MGFPDGFFGGIRRVYAKGAAMSFAKDIRRNPPAGFAAGFTAGPARGSTGLRPKIPRGVTQGVARGFALFLTDAGAAAHARDYAKSSIRDFAEGSTKDLRWNVAEDNGGFREIFREIPRGRPIEYFRGGLHTGRRGGSR